MARPQAVPIGVKIEEAERRADGAYMLPEAFDVWPGPEVDPAREYARLLRGYAHDRRPIAIGDVEHDALVITGPDGTLFVEIDAHGSPIAISEAGLRAVRRADELQASPPEDGFELDRALTEIAAAATGERVALRVGLFERLRTWLGTVLTGPLPTPLYRLVPWELLDANVEAARAAIAGEPADSPPIFGDHFARAAPGVAPAVARLRESASEDGALREHADALRDALAAIPSGRIPALTARRLEDLLEAARAPKRRDICVARLDRLPPRLVVVLANFGGEHASLVALLTNEIEYATHRDVRVEPEETGLEYPVLIETDIAVPVWNSQLDEPIGRLSPELDALLRPRPDPKSIPARRTGQPLAGPWDSRWAWKERELDQLQRLGAACFAALSGIAEARECDGDVTDPVTRVEIATGVVVGVGMLDGDAAPRVCWTEGDAAAEALGRSVAAAASDDDDLASAVRTLALAEARFAAHPVKLWTLDSALAAFALFDAVGHPDARRPDRLGQLLAERIPQAVDALVELGGLAHEPEVIEIVQSFESRLRELRDWMSPALAARLDAWLAEYELWRFVWSALGRLEQVGTKRADRRSVPVSPDLVVAGLVDDDAVLTLDTVPEDEGVRLASVPLSARVSDALRALRAADEKPAFRWEREVASMRFEAVAGHQATRGWLHVFDPDSGDVLHAFELAPSEDDGGKRLRLSTRVPSELVTGEATRRHGAIVARRRLSRVDPIALIGLLYVTVVVKPLVTGDFAWRVQQEFAAAAVKAQFLRTAQAAYRLSAEDEHADLGDREAFVEARLAELYAGGTAAEFPSEAIEGSTARVFRYVVEAYHTLAEEVVQRLTSHRLRRLAEADEAAAVQAALEDSADRVVTVRQLRALLP